MEERESLNNKYQKIDIDETSEEVQKPEKKQKKEKKAKSPKEPKVKKEKTPKEPKVKKEKTPKPEKTKKEKKVKEPKPSKIKKEKKNKTSAEIKENTVEEVSVTEEAKTEQTVIERRSEEIVMPKVKSVKKEKSPKQKKKKPPKEPKAKKEKTPKPEKVKKEKKDKAPKPEKAKKEKPEKAPKPPKEKKPREPLNKKDYVTIGVAVFALVLVIAFAVIKFMPESEIETDFTESTTQSQDKLSNIQIARDGITRNLIQSDIPDVFYGFSSDYKLQYYQYRDNKMKAVQSTGTVSASIELGSQTIPVNIEYVELGGKIFGAGLFVANKSDNVFFYDLVAFQLVNLPKGYEQDGKALLLATTNKSFLTQGVTVWPESFVVDLQTGKTTRFLKIINRNIDMSTGAGVEDFCMLTKDGYMASNAVPFISSREYEAGSGKQDIFIKKGNNETLFASDVYGKFLLTDGDAVIFMRKTAKGFDVIRKTGDDEKVTLSFTGAFSGNYISSGEYIFNKNDGKLYNLKTGDVKTVIGYRMHPEMFAVSPDGKHLVMLGTVLNMMDYQVHVFNLETGEYTKYKDENYSSHTSLTFINNTTAVYMVLDPNQGYEYVVIDVTKAK